MNIVKNKSEEHCNFLPLYYYMDMLYSFNNAIHNISLSYHEIAFLLLKTLTFVELY